MYSNSVKTMKTILLIALILAVSSAVFGAQSLVLDGSTAYATTTVPSHAYTNRAEYAAFEFTDLRNLRLSFGSLQVLMDISGVGELRIPASSTNLQWVPDSGSGTVTLGISGRTTVKVALSYSDQRGRYMLQVWDSQGRNYAESTATTTDHINSFVAKDIRLGANLSGASFAQMKVDHLHWRLVERAPSAALGFTPPWPSLAGITYNYTIGVWDFEGDGTMNATYSLVSGMIFTATNGTYETTPNIAPVSVPRARSGASLGTILLDGSRSYDVDNTLNDAADRFPVSGTATWTCTSVPAGHAGCGSLTVRAPSELATWVDGANTAGAYVFSLQVSDGSLTDTQNVTINVAALSVSLSIPATAYEGEPVIVDASASTGWNGGASHAVGYGGITVDLGDKFPGQATNWKQYLDKSAHSFWRAGTYSVCVSATNALSSSAGPSCQSITVSAIPAATAPNTATLTDTGNAATNTTNLQNAINTAATATSAEREIVLPAGFVSNPVNLPAITGTKSASGYITIKSANLSSLPARFAGRASSSTLSNMARIQSAGFNAPAVTTSDGTHHWRFQGIEFYTAGNVQGGLIRLGQGNIDQNQYSQQPHHILFDRIVSHGSATLSGVRRGLEPSGYAIAMVDSTIYQIGDSTFDSQGVGSYNSQGQQSYINNQIEATTENVIFGGAVGGIEGIVPEDIEFRGNYFSKPLSWKADDPAYGGIDWSIKNSFELKYGRRVVIDGNFLFRNWADSQTGEQMLFNSSYDSGDQSQQTQDIQITNNRLSSAQAGFNFAGGGFPGIDQMERILIYNNFIDDMDVNHWSTGGGGGAFGHFYSVRELTIMRNTSLNAVNGNRLIAFSNMRAGGFFFRDNIGVNGDYGVLGDGGNFGTPALTRYTPGAVFTKSVIIGAQSAGIPYPTGNYVSTATVSGVGFTSISGSSPFSTTGGVYSLTTGSTFHNAASDSTSDPGVDWTAYTDALRGVVNGVWITSVSQCNWHTSPPCGNQ